MADGGMDCCKNRPGISGSWRAVVGLLSLKDLVEVKKDMVKRRAESRGWYLILNSLLKYSEIRKKEVVTLFDQLSSSEASRCFNVTTWLL